MPPVRHAVQRELDDAQSLEVAGAGVVTQQELVDHGLGELRLHAETAVPVVKLGREAGEGAGEVVWRDQPVSAWGEG